jgi:hypothetical protein
MGEAILPFDTRDESRLPFDATGVAALYSGPDASVAFGRVPPGGAGMQGLADEGCEDNLLVLSGMLCYPTSPGQEVFAARGAWVPAPPGEIHGYWNRSAKPVRLFFFRPRTRGLTRVPGSGPRISVPAEPQAAPRVTAYETSTSRGEVLALGPGANAAFGPALVRSALVTAGRVMALAGGEKISLDAGEGLVFRGISVEFVGVGGQSSAAVFSTVR